MKPIANPHVVIAIQVPQSAQLIMVAQSAHGHGQTIATITKVVHAARTVMRHVIKSKTIKNPQIILGIFYSAPLGPVAALRQQRRMGKHWGGGPRSGGGGYMQTNLYYITKFGRDARRFSKDFSWAA